MLIIDRRSLSDFTARRSLKNHFPLSIVRWPLANYPFLHLPVISCSCLGIQTPRQPWLKTLASKVKMVYSSSTVSFFYNKERIAFHKRNQKQFGYSTIKEHLPSSHQFVSDWNPDKFLSWAAGIDPIIKDYIQKILQSKIYPEQAYRSCVGILAQEKKVGKQRLIKAVERAIHYGAYNYKIIDRILKGGMDRLAEDFANQVSLPFHENIRGADNYQ